MIQAVADAGSQALTTGDFLSIAALCAVIVGALLSPMWAYTRRTRKRLMDLESQDPGTVDERKHRKVIAATTARGLAGASNSLEFLAGMLQRTFDERLGEVDSEQALYKLQRLRSEVERAWMELRLLTGDRAEQTSALQQLERIGDQRTIRSMELLLQDEVRGVSKGRIEETMQVIRRRVDSEADDADLPPAAD